MKNQLKNFVKRLANTKICVVLYHLYFVISKIEYTFYNLRHKCQNKSLSNTVCKNVTFMFKSFERQNLAKMLYKCIRKYYPTAKIVIADDSKQPLKLNDNDYNLKIVQLPFNSGLSKGLNEAIKYVDTPFVFRMDDDELLLNNSNIEKELAFLQQHSDVDLVGFLFTTPISHIDPLQIARGYKPFAMKNAPKPLKVKHGTKLDKNHYVMGKVPNIWLARTEKIKQIGWDDNIRMIDHHEFFYRCAGNIVSAISLNAVVWHQHNPFDKAYLAFRNDYKNDVEYIENKYNHLV